MLILGLRSVQIRSILGVCEEFGHKRNDKVALLDG